MSHKKGGLVFKKSGSLSLISILPNPFQCYFSLNEWSVCVFYLFTPYLSSFFVFHGENLVLLNLGNKYMASTSQ